MQYESQKAGFESSFHQRTRCMNRKFILFLWFLDVATMETHCSDLLLQGRNGQMSHPLLHPPGVALLHLPQPSFLQALPVHSGCTWDFSSGQLWLQDPLSLAMPSLELHCSTRLFTWSAFLPLFLTRVRPTLGLKAPPAYCCSFINNSLACLTCLRFCYLMDSSNTIVFSFVKHGPWSMAWEGVPKL